MTVIKTTGTKEGKVFYSIRYVGYLQVVARSFVFGLGHVTFMTVR